ncbi:hypothetical protein WN48_00717 [Eufriesea mexicana]|uniref:Uncharacterized protein n=1 Tax=Eufriesea mexicana TaxID=516756 RepID=A0A310SD34_9HYME|nr:hypothetical protein WN48_00717 [Eufriesea mexicana]
MGFLRMLFAYFLRNESLIDKLSNTKPIRRSAQFVAHLILKSKTHGIYLPFDRDKFLERLRNFIQTYEKKLKEAKDEQKKNSPK